MGQSNRIKKGKFIMSKFLEFVTFLNSVFYGEYWFIAWGVVLLLFVPVAIKEAPNLIKSIKEANKRSNSR